MKTKLALCAFLFLSFSALMHGSPPKQNYFPGQTDTVLVELTPYLEIAQEPVLWNLAQTNSRAEVYRLIISPGWGINLIYRLEVQPDRTGILTLVKLGAQTGPILRKARFLLSARGVGHFRDLLEKDKFWDRPHDEYENFIPEFEVDLVCEGVQAGRYHYVVDRASPARASAHFLLNLTNETVDWMP